MKKLIFPEIKKGLEDFLYEEEGNIPRGKILSIGSLMIMLSVLYSNTALAHGSHASHASHVSHESHASSAGSHYSMPVVPVSTPYPVITQTPYPLATQTPYHVTIPTVAPAVHSSAPIADSSLPVTSSPPDNSGTGVAIALGLGAAGVIGYNVVRHGKKNK